MPDDKAQPSSDRRIGQRFGDYVVEDQIGRGGMGVVFRARHLVSGKVVALKLMAPDLADNLSFRERFIREAEAGPQLGHPNIVDVFESGEADGELFIAMELIEGTDLKNLIRQEGRLDPKRALSIFRQAAEALDSAHEAGMVHRDVKPQNILVIPRGTPEGKDRVYLTDFGLVRPVTSETSASRTGQVFGSVAYMAPELIEGIPADGRADVYALGCVLYECLTGNVPFERDNEVSAVWAHIHEDPPLLTDARRDLPGGLNDVVIKAMAKHPDDRFLTAGEFITDLEQGLGRKLSALKYSHVRPLVARIPRRKTEREVWAPNFFPELSRVRAETRERFNWRKALALAAAVALISSVQVGRDGGIPQVVADVADAADSLVEAVIAPEPEPQTNGTEVAGTDQEPPGEATGAGGLTPSDRKQLRDLLPNDERGSTDAGKPSGSAVGPSAAFGRIAWAREELTVEGNPVTDIWVMDADGSNKTRLTVTAAEEFWPSWSPDGSHIAYVRMSPDVGTDFYTHEIWVMDADGTNQRNSGLCPGIEDCGRLAWSPNGRRVAYAQGDDLFVADLASGTRRLLVSGEVTPASRPDAGGGPGPTWSPNGKWLVYTCGYSLCVVGAAHDGQAPRVIGPTLMDPQWSPTGRWIVGEYQPGDEGGNVFIVRSDGKDRRRLTDATGTSGRWKPCWAPDGTAIVYSDWSTGSGLLFRVDVDGSDRVQLTSGPNAYTPDWWGPSE